MALRGAPGGHRGPYTKKPAFVAIANVPGVAAVSLVSDVQLETVSRLRYLKRDCVPWRS